MKGRVFHSVLLLVVAASGCAGPPPQPERESSFAVTSTSSSPLAEKVRALRDSGDAGSGVLLLPEGLEAFLARAALATVATHGIDAQYYLWHDDLVGLSLLALLKQAADRGVRVRLLIDDIDLGDKDRHLAALSSHPHFEVRVFNPFSRRWNRGIQYISRFGSVTRRMHNKSFTVDNRATVVGGRNIGDEYFEADPDVTFGDLDALVIGPVVQEVSNAFDAYWNSDLAYPIEALLKQTASVDEGREVSEYLDQYLVDTAQSRYAQALQASTFIEEFRSNSLVFQWADARVIVDAPEKLSENRDRTDLTLSGAVAEAFAAAEREIIIFSPYFIPGDDGSEGLIRLANGGVRVRILTNSLASNNHRIVHAKYAKYRRRLLDAGVELYEAKAEMPPRNVDSPFGGTKETVLHAKSFVVDRQTVFIGSLNFDPRSFVENTEIGLIVESEAIASNIGRWFDESIDTVAYRLALDSSGRGKSRLVWNQGGAGEQTVLHHEPATSWWVRFTTRVMSWLPVESQL